VLDATQHWMLKGITLLFVKRVVHWCGATMLAETSLPSTW
jgi:hypothetical protein